MKIVQMLRKKCSQGGGMGVYRAVRKVRKVEEELGCGRGQEERDRRWTVMHSYLATCRLQTTRPKSYTRKMIFTSSQVLKIINFFFITKVFLNDDLKINIYRTSIHKKLVILTTTENPKYSFLIYLFKTV